MTTNDRRRIQRVQLSPPLSGRIRTQNVHIMDISLRGFRIAHQAVIGRIGEPVVVVFDWEGHHIQAHCEIRRSELQRVGRASYSHTLYHSGLSLQQGDEESRRLLRELISEHVTRTLDEQRAALVR